MWNGKDMNMHWNRRDIVISHIHVLVNKTENNTQTTSGIRMVNILYLHKTCIYKSKGKNNIAITHIACKVL